MHAYLIVGHAKDENAKTAEVLAKSRGKTLMPVELRKISDTKSLIHLSNLKIGNSAFFIERIDLATEEAANAFLKTLEETDQKTLFILTANSESAVLPTILSRCSVIRSNNGSEFSLENAKKFLNLSDAERYEIIRNIKEREVAVEFLTDMIYSLNQLLLEGNNIKAVSTALRLAEKTKFAISANANVSLQLANFAINL